MSYEFAKSSTAKAKSFVDSLVRHWDSQDDLLVENKKYSPFYNDCFYSYCYKFCQRTNNS